MNYQPLRLEADPVANFPVSLAQVKTQNRIDHDEFDSLIQEIHMPAAAHWVEAATKRAVLAREHRLILRDFPRDYLQQLTLIAGKVQSIESIVYASGGSTVTLSGPTSTTPGTDYREEFRGDLGAILMPPYGQTWPSVESDSPAPVVVTFRAGWESGAVPPALVQAMIWYVQDAIDGDDSKARHALVAPWQLNQW